MLDAFARELPVVAMERATAALPLHNACVTVPNDDAHALAGAAHRLFVEDYAGAALRREARRYLATHHCVDAYAIAMHELLGRHALSTYAPTRLLLDPN
jgi:hypothetical protein